MYTLIIQPGYPGIPVGQFTRANVVAKEFSGPAWIWVSTRQWSEPAYLPLGAADPREVGGYRIVARLGSGRPAGSTSASGGFAGARRRRPGWVALKVFDQDLVADPAVRRRLSLGAIAARVAREQHVASLIDSAVDDDQDQPWVASTLVRGPSLAAAVAETGPLPAARRAGSPSASPARSATLHEAGLTHDAVTPRNVLLDAQRAGAHRPSASAGPR